MNAREDSPNLVSSTVPFDIEENATFIVDLDALSSQSNLFRDANGIWKMNGGKMKFSKVHKNRDTVVSIEKVNTQEETDISIRRRKYVAQSCSTYHRTIIAVEYGKEIAKWYPLVLLSYHYDGPPKKFNPQQHGNRKGSSHVTYFSTKESMKLRLADNMSNGEQSPRCTHSTLSEMMVVLLKLTEGILQKICMTKEESTYLSFLR